MKIYIIINLKVVDKFRKIGKRSGNCGRKASDPTPEPVTAGGGWVALGEHFSPSSPPTLSLSRCVVNWHENFHRGGSFQMSLDFFKRSLYEESYALQTADSKTSAIDPKFRLVSLFLPVLAAGINLLRRFTFRNLRKNMKFIIGAAVALLGTCAFAADGTKISEQTYQLPQCATPVASVVVGKLVCKAASCMPVAQDPTGLSALVRLAGGTDKASFPNFGEGMSAMLTTALKSTNCFDIQEREAMDELAKELALVGKKVEVQQADFMISGSITSLNLSTETKEFGGGLFPVIGMISTTKKTADLGLDIKVIDVNRAKVLDSRTFTANNETTNTSFGGIGFGGIGVLAGGMSSYKDTPLEPIIREILAQVASFTATKLVNLKGAASLSNAPVANADVAVPASVVVIAPTK